MMRDHYVRIFGCQVLFKLSCVINRKKQCKSINMFFRTCRSSCPEMFCKKGVLKHFAKFTGKHLCQNLFLIVAALRHATFLKKETLAQVFSCEFCEILKNTLLTEYLRWLILNMGLKLWGHPFSKLNLQMIAKAGSNENPIVIPSTYVQHLSLNVKNHSWWLY